MGSKYWQSLNERAGSEEFTRHLEAEFASEFSGDGVSRRHFIQIMGASIALAGLAGCEWPEEEIVPFGKRPESYQPGRMRQYASMFEDCGVVRPVLVTSYDGRPIKIEGNPDHPLSGGATDLQGQAAVLDLYDPDRLRHVTRRHKGLTIRSSWDEFDRFLPGQLDGTRLAVIAEPSRSPSRARLRRTLEQKFPGLGWFEFSVADVPTELHGLESLFGQPAELEIDLDGVMCIADFDADLLGAHRTALRNSRQFAAGRDPHHDMSRLWVVEPTWSVTGTAADHRMAASPDGVHSALLGLARALVEHGHLPNASVLAGLPAGGTESPWIRALAADLVEHAGRGLVAAGVHAAPDQHELAARINLALGNGAAKHRRRPAALGPASRYLAAFDPADFDTALVLGGDPVHDTVGELADALSSVGCSIYLGQRANATSDLCSWVLPAAHALECWGDAIAIDASLCLQQPLISPLHGGRGDLRVLGQFAGTGQTDHEIVQETFAALGADRSWREALHAGLARIEVPAPLTRANGTPRVLPRDEATGLEIHTFLDRKLRDGRYANNAWLQELPDPITKLTWDNVALFAVSTAEELGIVHGDVVRLDTEDGRIEIPAMLLPGQHERTVSVALGYGRTREGRVGKGVGVDALELSRRGPVSVVRTGRRVVLACTQDHWAIDPRGKQERTNRIGMLVREGTVTELREHPEFVEHRGIHHPPLRSLWEERTPEGAAWGMAIDLNKCTGCSACVVACVAENNIPVVGKDQVRRGREMHWLRIDRYFAGEPSDPSVASMPMACVHCEMAPCEQVCPVGATMHSAEGLNVMAYNRCVGTRYCSNNCPYKVRRFNFFEYNGDLPELERLGKNPEVTIRSRGVMEKCTYCVQRIEHARITAKNEGRPIADGEIRPACQQTCATQAITFGDLMQEGSEVAQLHQDHRSYAALAELNVKPRTRYLARIRNPHPSLAGEAHHGGEHHEEEASHG